MCGKNIIRKPRQGLARYKKQKLCSLKCRQKYLVKKKLEKFIPKNCLYCGKEIKIRDSRRKFCGDKCFRKYSVRENNPSWKGGLKKHGKYLQRLVGKEHPFSDMHGYIMEHRNIMEQWLKNNKPSSEYLVEIKGEKYLSPLAKIHHKDHDKHNNNIKNLHIVTSQREHFHFNYCPHCPHCLKSDELLENPEKDNQHPS